MKKLLTIISIVILATSMVACVALDAFAAFEKAAKDELNLVDQYEVIQPTDLDDQTLNQLSFDDVQALSTTLGDDNLTNSEKVAYIRELYQAIQVVRAENILLKVETKAVWSELKLNVTAFREAELTLSEEHKTMLSDYKNEFTLRRLEVEASIGSIKSSLETLKGNYDLEHLDLIIEHFESILDVLSMRHDHLAYLNQALIDVNSIALTYLNS
ncbi:MAG: hypothetical protein K9L02_04125 [Acholeplasmataceae bacterium]|nr:hypothetical protein [Acholeplasmataceae bacterium]